MADTSKTRPGQPEQIESHAGPPGISVREWFGDWGGKLTVVYGLLVIFHILFVVFHWGGQDFLSPVSNIIAVVIYSGPCLLAWRVSRHKLLSPRMRRAWLLVALANLSFLIGEAIWLYSENVLGIQPFPSVADVGYLLFYPLMMAALLSMVERFKSVEERLNFWLDASVIMIAGAMVMWEFLLRRIMESSDGYSLKIILSIAYPVGDVVLLLGISSLLFRRAGFGSRSTINILLAGVVVNFLADLLFGYENLQGTYATGDPVDAMFTIACFPVMLAAHLQYLNSSQNATVSANAQSSARLFWVPYVGVAIAYLILLQIGVDEPTSSVGIVTIIAGVLTALVIFRQFMFVRENSKANKDLTVLEERIQGIYSASTDAIGLADFEGTITEINDSFIRLTGFSREEIIGVMTYRDFVPDNYLDRSITPEMAIETGRAVEYERDLTRKDGIKKTVTTTLYTVNDAGGQPAAMAIVIRDITERRSLEQKLKHQAMHDPLTGLANRALLGDSIKRALSRARRLGKTVAILFLDLDNFKPVNDALGHAAGDAVLIAVSDRLGNCIRGSDMAARLGGDEFAVLLEDISGPDEEIRVANRILEAISSPIPVDGKDVYVGASIGLAVSSDKNEDAEELLQNADVAMYIAKKQGKSCYAVFEPSMHAAVIRRAQIESDLRLALSNDEFEVRYQPIIELATGKVLALEALLRWNNPRRLDVGPAEFIPIAEEADLISDIGQWILQESCDQVSEWNRGLTLSRPISIAVNISGRQFQEPTFLESLQAALHHSGLSPQNLILEITESLILKNTEQNVATLRNIRELGVRLAIDDFGTGYSSLSYLHRFPVDILKIDRSFVEKVSSGIEGAAMANAIISMSRTLHLTTIAEGIETIEQVETLRSLRCELGQGYLFAEPLTPQETRLFLSNAYSEPALEPLLHSESPNFIVEAGDVLLTVA